MGTLQNFEKLLYFSKLPVLHIPPKYWIPADCISRYLESWTIELTSTSSSSAKEMYLHKCLHHLLIHFHTLVPDILGELFARLVVVKASVGNTKDKMQMDKFEKLSCQVHEYELLVRQLKEQLREEKLKAKEEAEDLAQEMAELRYQITGLLEEECKRRACIEQISLQRITELETQLEKARKESFTAVRDITDA